MHRARCWCMFNGVVAGNSDIMGLLYCIGCINMGLAMVLSNILYYGG